MIVVHDHCYCHSNRDQNRRKALVGGLRDGGKEILVAADSRQMVRVEEIAAHSGRKAVVLVAAVDASHDHQKSQEVDVEACFDDLPACLLNLDPDPDLDDLVVDALALERILVEEDHVAEGLGFELATLVADRGKAESCLALEDEPLEIAVYSHFLSESS